MTDYDPAYCIECGSPAPEGVYCDDCKTPSEVIDKELREMKERRETAEKQESKITVLKFLPGVKPGPDLPWWAIGLRVLGLLLTRVVCVLVWASVIAGWLLGPLWGLGGLAVTALMFIVGLTLLAGRFDP